MRTFARAVVTVTTDSPGEQAERHVERLDAKTPVVKERLGFLFKKRQTS